MIVSLLFSSALASQPCYEIHFRNYYGGAMREEAVIERAGEKGRAVQFRIFENASNELREARFLQKNGKWREYGDSNLPSPLQREVEKVTNAGLPRIEANGLPVTPMEIYKPGALGYPVFLPKLIACPESPSVQPESSGSGRNAR